MAKLEAQPAFPSTEADLKALVAAAPDETLTWLYRAGELIRAHVNERWSAQ